MAVEHVEPDDTGKSADPAPKSVTEEQLNKAITARFRKFEEKMETQFSAFATSSQEAVVKAIADSMPKAPEALAATGKQSDSPELAGLKKQLAALEKDSQKLAQERDEERKRSKDSELRQKLNDELSKYGVVNARHAVAFLVDAEKRIGWDEDGNSLIFKDSDGDVDLATGVKSWVQTDDGKIYLPARGTAGTGGRKPPTRTAQPTEELTRENVASALWEAVHK